MRHTLLRHLEFTKMNGQGPIPKTQHVHDQQMFTINES